jgi:hypothetical protein
MSEALAQSDYILVMERAYGKLERLDDSKIHGQSFVIRNITCQLRTPQCRSKQRHRVMMFQDFEGQEIRVPTAPKIGECFGWKKRM